MKRLFGTLSGIAVAAFTLALAVPGQAPAARPRGGASASSQLVHLTVGAVNVSGVGDSARATRNATESAFARFVAGSAGRLMIGEDEREITGSYDTKSAQRGLDVLEIPTLLRVTRTGTRVVASVTPDSVSSTVSAQLSGVDLLGGFAVFEGASSDTVIRVNDGASTVERTLGIDRLSALPLGALLAHTGVDPAAIGCAQLAASGAQLGAGLAGQLCDRLHGAQASLDAARALLSSGRDEIQSGVDDLRTQTSGTTRAGAQAAREQVASLECGALDFVCEAQALAAIVPIASEYGVGIGGLGFVAAKSAVVARLDSLLVAFDGLDAALADLADVEGGLARAAVGTCPAVLGALDSVGAAVPALAGSLSGPRESAAWACDSLAAAGRDVLGAPLVRFDGLHVALGIDAHEGDPEAKVSGTLEDLRVGLSSIPLPDGGDVDAIARVEGALSGAIGGVTGALGIGYPEPVVELMHTDSSSGKRKDGSWFARGSIALLRIVVPPATADPSGADPLLLLAGMPGIPSPATSPAGSVAATGDPGESRAAAVQTRALTLDVGVFEAGGDYISQATGNPGPDPAPGDEPITPGDGPGGDDVTSPSRGGNPRGGLGDSPATGPNLPLTGGEPRAASTLTAILALAGALFVARYLRAAT